jgi:hypothetical protein
MASSEEVIATHQDASSSGVSWGAVIGGGFVMAAVWLLMLFLGAGFELSSLSPWFNAGASAATVGTIALVWIIVTQVIAASLGGYLTGRLRTRWQSIHNDEVHFRDTANGLVAWAVSVVLAAGLLVVAARAMAGGESNPEQSALAQQGASVLSSSYLVDRLFRSDHPAEIDGSVRAEASRTIAYDLLTKLDSGPDIAYLTQLVAAKTGLSTADASKRVSDALTEARQRADNVRKASARVLLWTFLALLIGAFCASFAATLGGSQRDNVKLI